MEFGSEASVPRFWFGGTFSLPRGGLLVGNLEFRRHRGTTYMVT